ncbi:alkaline phosphatase D family protein [Nocardioides lentus]|uniref:Alkaline phosphatase D family protein n=1 Tax=Nocardioides lentus TaxID=338077 RepID=A0ABP5B427_9ACTN
MQTSRRTVLSAGAVTGGALLVGSAAAPAPAEPRDRRATAAAQRLPADPFTLGVASGDPAPDGFVIWTRLAPSPTAADGLGGMPSSRYQVRFQVATTRRFRGRDVVKRGEVTAGPETAHAVHVELRGLEPGRPYYYRFAVGRWTSPVGRGRTAPRPGALASLTMAFTSCSNYPAGFFTAYRHLAEERPDLVLNLGDYQYEGAQGANALGRPHLGPETTTLAGYRQRHAQYKTDPDLQAAHAAAPWVVVWDDHELDNNWADDVSEKPAEQGAFAARRVAAFRAYYENMPLRRTSVPRGPDLQLYRRIQWGRTATFHMLDTRQYRDDQGCGDGFRTDCPAADDPARTLTGDAQEQWLIDGFRESTARWDLLGQQVFFGRRDSAQGAEETVSMDAWDGYAASRDRVVQGWQDARVRNPVVLTGDVHAHWASEVLRDPEDGDSAVLGSELVTSSITSGGDGYDQPDGEHPWADWNPNLRFWTNLRGYVSTTITPDSLTADFRCVPRVTTPDAGVFTRRRYVIEDQVRGLQLALDDPQPPASFSARSLPSDEQIIRDTIREETGY